MRIVSLLPSATEMICGIGLRTSLVGVTHECDFPPDVTALPSVTRSNLPSDATSGEIDSLVREQLQSDAALYQLDRERLIELRPDLIVTQALCDVCAVSESDVNAAVCDLAPATQVINLEPTCLEEVFESIRVVGKAANVPEKANDYVDSLMDRVRRVKYRSESLAQQPSVILLEWIDPPFSSGHWNPELVRLAGGHDVLGRAGQRSETLTWDAILAADPDVLVIACCGFDLRRAREDLPILESYPGWRQLRCVRHDSVHWVDGSAYFNRPGPRLVDSLEILANLLHPNVHPAPKL